MSLIFTLGPMLSITVDGPNSMEEALRKPVHNDCQSSTTKPQVSSFSPFPSKVYGHLHYAKTAGTTINGVLAAKYERVCGTKGYSYDAYQFNKRVERRLRKFNVSSLSEEKAGGNDLVNKSFPDWNRGRVPQRIMDEIGYENCDYVSFENPSMVWNRMNETWNFELHVPCRDPVAHLRSQCNHKGRTFNCQASNLVQEAKKCFVAADRFHPWLPDQHQPHLRNHSIKCFNPIPVQPYLDYMGERLQHKRAPATYIHRSTNKVHANETQCLNDPVVADRVRTLLIEKIPYFEWCHQCMDDPDQNLLFSPS